MTTVSIDSLTVIISWGRSPQVRGIFAGKTIFRHLVRSHDIPDRQGAWADPIRFSARTQHPIGSPFPGAPPLFADEKRGCARDRVRLSAEGVFCYRVPRGAMAPTG